MKRLVLAIVVLLAGCGAEVAGEPPASYAPDELVLQVRTSGGLVPVETLVTAVPEISVYGDGRVITPGAASHRYPAPAVPNLEVRRTTPENVRKLAKRALEAGVGNGADLGTPQVMDAGATMITVRAEGGLLTSDAPALGVDDGLSMSQRQARRRLSDLVRYLRELPLGASVAYEPRLVAAVGREWVERQGEVPAVDFPGASLPGGLVGGLGVPCLVTEAGPVLAAGRSADARTPWLSGGRRWAVSFRVLLPHELSCEDLVRR
ncbi:hypothetical protein [Dactylosporangium sp. NPDC049140]|uniref:hypothetical protein n=1 Tax=Dactylosporangium sp. NPDC049140 TaxID=3155647 RepID=UPI003411B5B1